MKKIIYGLIGISVMFILFVIIHLSTVNNNQAENLTYSVSNASYQNKAADIPLIDPINKTFLTYSNQLGQMKLTLYGSIYDYFTNESRPPITTEGYYDYKEFLSNSNDDGVIQEIVNQALIASNNDSVAAVSILIPLVQNIPYDYNTSIDNVTYRKYPYETLYTDTGVCDEKSVLLDKLLEKLGYGIALFDYPQMDHMTAAIQCPLNESNYGSGYCAIETTGAYPVGEISLFYGNSWNERVSSQNAIPTVIVIDEGETYPFVNHPF